MEFPMFFWYQNLNHHEDRPAADPDCAQLRCQEQQWHRPELRVAGGGGSAVFAVLKNLLG